MGGKRDEQYGDVRERCVISHAIEPAHTGFLNGKREQSAKARVAKTQRDFASAGVGIDVRAE